MRQTSLWAFEDLLADPGKLNRQQQLVLSCIRSSSGVTDRMISSRTGLERNVVPARRGELVGLGLVVEGFIGKCPEGGKLATFWRLRE